MYAAHTGSAKNSSTWAQQERRVRIAAISIFSSRETVEHDLISGGGEFEQYSKVKTASDTCSAIKIAGRVQDQSAKKSATIDAVETVQDGEIAGSVYLEDRSLVEISAPGGCAVQVSRRIQGRFGIRSVSINPSRKAMQHYLSAVLRQLEYGPMVIVPAYHGGAVKIASRISRQTSIRLRPIKTVELV